VQSGDSELVVCEIGQGGLAVAGTSGPLHQPLAAVEAGNKAGGLIAVGPGGLQVRAGRTDFEDAAEGGMANACSCRRPEPPPGEHYRPRGSLHGLWACTTARSDEKVSFPERAGLPWPSTRSLLIGKSRFRGIPHTPIMLGNSEEEVALLPYALASRSHQASAWACSSACRASALALTGHIFQPCADSVGYSSGAQCRHR
jgi:hypothetical protein